MAVTSLDKMMLWVIQQPDINRFTWNTDPTLTYDYEQNVVLAYVGVGLEWSIVVVKFNRRGQVMWVKLIETSSFPISSPSIAVDKDNNIHVAFTIYGGAISGQTYSGYADIALVKMDSNGNIFWFRQHPPFNTDSDDYSPSLVIDSQNNCYISYQGGPYTLTTYFGQQINIVKFDIDGNVVWVRQVPLNYGEQPRMKIDPFDRLWLVYVSQYMTVDVRVAQFDQDGNMLWMNQNPIYNTVGVESQPNIATDHMGNAYIVYVSDDALSGRVPTYPHDSIIFKLDGNGNLLWVKQFPQLGGEINSPVSITVDSHNNVYISYHAMIDDPYSPIRKGILKVVKIDPDGNLMWIASKYTYDDSTSIDHLYICIDINDYLYMSWTTIVAYSGQTQTGQMDIIVMKLLTQTECLRPQITTDQFDNLYYVYQSNMMNDGNPNQGFYDIVIVKKDNDGNTLWVRQNPIFNTPEIDQNPTIITYQNYCYVAYQTNGSISGADTSYPYDIVILKWDDNGNLIWAYQQQIFNTTRSDQSPSIDVDHEGNLYVVYQSTGVISGGYRTAIKNKNDIIIFKMDQSGQMLWTRQNNQFNTKYGNSFPKIKCDTTHQCFYVAYTVESQIMGQTFNGYSDIAISKLDLDGNVVWVREQPTFNTDQYDQDVSLCVDIYGYIYLCYTTLGTISGGSHTGGYDLVICKMDSNGNVLNLKQNIIFNTLGNQLHPTITYRYKFLYLAYQTSGSVSGQSSLGKQDIVVMKIDTRTLDVIWITQNRSANSLLDETFPSIAVDSEGSSYIAYETTSNLANSFVNLETSVVISKFYNSGPFAWIKQI